jgi:S1-C subfamily serine protease
VRFFVFIGVSATALFLFGLPPAGADDPAQAVFFLQVVPRGDLSSQSTVYGTAFFISSDGTALTNSHVVYQAAHEPARYALLAVVDREFYSASIVCASQLAHDPTAPASAGPAVRDVAMVKLAPSTFPFPRWQLLLPNGHRLLTVSAHRAALPRFLHLTVAGRPSSGQQVRAIGFGHLFGPQRQTMIGQVLEIGRAADGTEIFGIDFRDPTIPGNSGSPVLNPQNQVIGMWAWHSVNDANIGMAISNSAFLVPCR